MTELGARLKEARVSKGYSLDDLQEITKIQKRYLSAIEEGNYSIMPGTFYVRAFIKQYAEAVGLDSNELLETFKSEIPANNTVQNVTATTNIQQPQQRRTLAKKTAKKSSDWMPKIIVALFIIIIIAAIWFLKQHNSSSEVVDEPKQEDVKVESTNVKTNSNKDKEATKTETSAKEKTTDKTDSPEEKTKQKISKGVLENDSVTTTYTLTGAKDFKVKVKVMGSTWVGIQDETGKEISSESDSFKADQMYSDGDEIDVDATGKKSVRVRLGASANGTVYVNDEKIKFAATPAERYTQNIVIKFEEEK
ncbi:MULTISPECIES: RodZ domain-containing protein [unclassified Rummeliibacillus]|uniref:helix-turn-helix domain-containing protein n=1 Tax=unclassified Rummeliibacillus TaxID=2622809 RepID=UPI000E6701D2|nr:MULTISPECIES: RodZ domain-containing protein [unclassified Rummeliibacillus]RIJ69313.1 helix-turn-helix domain-containing protein [Rummeliibacillus sp. POC4]RPJ97045.1 helix-turn-helix domain-containing protein [Rummeliibacillus sp. TYF005]